VTGGFFPQADVAAGNNDGFAGVGAPWIGQPNEELTVKEGHDVRF